MNYLDNFLFGALMEMLCNNLVESFINLCTEINFPLALEKTEWATQIIVFLGMLIDMRNQTISIPEEKRDKAIWQIKDILSSKCTMVLKLQRLAGLLNFCCHAIIPGRVYTGSLYSNFKGSKQYHHVKVTQEVIVDTKVWLTFLEQQVAICQPFIDFEHTLKANELNWYTDMSGNPNLGCGGVFNDTQFFYKSGTKSSLRQRSQVLNIWNYMH